MRQRIDHLEEMVKKLIADREHVPQPAASSVSASESPASDSASAPTEECSTEDSAVSATTMVDGGHSVYVNGQDWYSVLQEVFRCFLFSILTHLVPVRCSVFHMPDLLVSRSTTSKELGDKIRTMNMTRTDDPLCRAWWMAQACSSARSIL